MALCADDVAGAVRWRRHKTFRPSLHYRRRHWLDQAGDCFGRLKNLCAGYPWIWFVARTYIDYKNDHLACALVPWVYLGIVQMTPSPAKVGWTRLIATALLAGSTILVKYSLAPVLAATGLYFLWLEGRSLTFTVEKMLRVA